LQFFATVKPNLIKVLGPYLGTLLCQVNGALVIISVVDGDTSPFLLDIITLLQGTYEIISLTVIYDRLYYETLGRFHQHVYVQLLRLQIPKAQKDSQVISVFLHILDLFEKKFCVKCW